MHLGTTTWQFRNSVPIGDAMQQAVRSHFAAPVILDIGPGGISGIGRFLHPRSNSDAWTVCQRFWGAAARFTDNIARSNPFGAVSCPELEEVYQASMALNPSRLVFVDIEQRVLDAGHRFARLVKRKNLFEFQRIDVVNTPIAMVADIVISYTVLARVSDQVKAMRNICSAVRPGGLLSISGRPGADFDQIGESLYRKSAN